MFIDDAVSLRLRRREIRFYDRRTEITGKYLQEDYSQQLLNDGAETVVGYVTLEKLGEGDYSVHISERQVVASSEYKDGYYIADNNVAKDVTLGAEGRIACQKGKELNVVSAMILFRITTMVSHSFIQYISWEILQS